jgi:hypothetical protein
MAYASGYITVEVDLNDYAGDFEIEFDDITDVIDTAEAHGYSKEDLIDWCFDFGGVSPAKFVQDYLNHDQIVELYNKSISERMDELQLTITNRNAKIRELEEKIAELSKSDEEVLEGVAY